MVRYARCRPKRFLLKLWVYMRRGHSAWLAFLMGLLNFIVIQYRLLIQYVEFFRAAFPSLTSFVAFFIATYVPLAILIGYIDYRRGAVPVEAESGPYWRRPTWKEYYITVPINVANMRAWAAFLEKMGFKEEAETLRKSAEKLEKWLRENPPPG